MSTKSTLAFALALSLTTLAAAETKTPAGSNTNNPTNSISGTANESINNRTVPAEMGATDSSKPEKSTNGISKTKKKKVSPATPASPNTPAGYDTNGTNVPATNDGAIPGNTGTGTESGTGTGGTTR